MGVSSFPLNYYDYDTEGCNGEKGEKKLQITPKPLWYEPAILCKIFLEKLRNQENLDKNENFAIWFCIFFVG